MNEYMQEYFEFLSDLRDGGSMNMMGAPRELQLNFGLNKADAREVFSKWCDSLKNEQCQARDTPVADPSGSIQRRQGFILSISYQLLIEERLWTGQKYKSLQALSRPSLEN